MSSRCEEIIKREEAAKVYMDQVEQQKKEIQGLLISNDDILEHTEGIRLSLPR